MTNNHKCGHHTTTGWPTADWAHAASYVAQLYTETLWGIDDPVENASELDHGFRSRLIRAAGVHQLSEEDLALVASLTEPDGIDLSYWPGGENYRVSAEAPHNPLFPASPPNALGLPGDMWAAVTDAEDGALVVALVAPAGHDDLEIIVPGGRGWEPLQDLSVIEGYTLVGVATSAADLFHSYDRDNTPGVISRYPLSPTGPFASEGQLTVPMPREIPPPRGEDDEFWANSGETYTARDAK